MSNAEKAFHIVSTIARHTWKRVLLHIQRRGQQWLDHLFRPFSFRLDGELQRHGTQLSLRFQSNRKPFPLLTESLLIDDDDEEDVDFNDDSSKWEPVVELSRNRTNDDDDENSSKIYSLSALSFSEFERVRLSLFFACAEQIMYRRQVFTNMFVLDECFAGVDTFGILLMLITLRMWATSVGANGNDSSTSIHRRAQFWHRSVFLSSALNLNSIVGFQFDSMVLIDKRGARHT